MSGKNSGSVMQGLRVGVRAMLHRRRDASLFLFTTVSQGFLQGLIIWVLRDVLLHLGASGSTIRTLLFGGLIVFGVWLLRAASTFAGQVLAVRLAYGVQMEQMVSILAKMLKLSVGFFDRNSQGDLMVSSYNDLKGVRQCTLETGNIVLHGARLLGLAVVAWVMSPKLAVIGLVLVPIGLIPAQRLGSYITNAARKEREELSGLFDSFLQVSAGARVIKVNSTQGRVLDRARETASQLYHLVVRQAYGASLGRFLFEAVSGFGLVMVLMVGGRDVAAGSLPWQSLLSLLVAIVAVYSPMLGLIQAYSAIRTVLPNLDR
ncbi:MAG TPA: ABC transporter transmembrane domain-containing protein, partial [Gemmatimonadaceae bacterium]